MIKELIADIAHERITLSQALNRAKVLACKLDSNLFQSWVKFELEGYPSADMGGNLPPYRIFPCTFKGTIKDIHGNTRQKPLTLHKKHGDLSEIFSFCYVREPVPILEKTIESISGSIVSVEFGENITAIFRPGFEESNPGLILVGTYQETPKTNFQKIIIMTQQRLLDTLLQLEKELPDIENKNEMDSKESTKIQNIVTNYIYGNNNPVNVAAGETISQEGFQFTTKIYNELEQLGVEKKDIDELKNIVITHQSDKSTLTSKVMKWLGAVAASVAAKGLAEHIPAITDFVHGLIG